MNAKELRKKHKHKRQPCYICGKHEHITELHHILSLKDCIKYIEKVNRIEIDRVWLCPNHHAYIHKIKQTKGKYVKVNGEDIPAHCLFICDAINKQERKKYLRILNIECENIENALFRSIEKNTERLTDKT